MAVDDGRLPRNPARPKGGESRKAYFLPRLPAAKKHRYLSHDELAKLAIACGDYETLVLAMGYCGPRWGEASALRVRDVDILRGKIRLERSVAEIGGNLIYGATKTGKVREVVVPTFLRARLEAQMEGKGLDDLLFTSPTGARCASATGATAASTKRPRPRTSTVSLLTAHATQPPASQSHLART